MAIRDQRTNYISVKIHHIIEYIFDMYSEVSVCMIEANNYALKTIDDHPQTPIDTVYSTVEDLVEYAEMEKISIN